MGRGGFIRIKEILYALNPRPLPKRLEFKRKLGSEPRIIAKLDHLP